MSRIDRAIEKVKELLGSDFTINKTLTSCSIVKQVQEFGGQRTIVRFNSIKELETFLEGLQELKFNGITL